MPVLYTNMNEEEDEGNYGIEVLHQDEFLTMSPDRMGSINTRLGAMKQYKVQYHLRQSL